MRHISLGFIPIVALMAVAPLPALADGAGPRVFFVPKVDDPSYQGFKTAQSFFALFLRSGGYMFGATWEIGKEEIQRKKPVVRSEAKNGQNVEAKNGQNVYVKWAAEERKRKEAERRARETERERKAAENRSEDDLPGLDY